MIARILPADLPKAFRILTPRDKRRLYYLAVIALVAAVLESLNVAIIFQLLQVAIEPERLKALPLIGDLEVVRRLTEFSDLVLFAAVTAAVVFLLKNAFLAYALYAQKRFVTEASATLGLNLLKRYLTTPYDRVFHRNSADLINNTMNLPPLVASQIIMPLVDILTEITVVCGITLVLLMNEPAITLAVIAATGCVMAAFYAFTRGRFRQWGVEQAALMANLIRIVQESLRGQKVIRTLGKEPHFLERFQRARWRLAKVSQYTAVLLASPRLITEVLMIWAIGLVIVLVLGQGRQPSEILPVLGLFALAGLRIMPSSNRLLVAFSTIRMGHAPVATIFEDFETLSPQPDSAERAEADGAGKAVFGHGIEIAGLSYAYPGGDRPALSDVTLTIRSGQSVGLVGASGAGKTTLADILLGLLRPTAGRLALDGATLDTTSPAWRRRVGYVPQEVFLIDDTLKRNIALGIADADVDRARLARAIDLASLATVVEALPAGVDSVVGERGLALSGGQRQRIGIARALYTDPEILVLDEATSALDAETEHEIIAAIERLRGEKTVIVIAHRLSTIHRCDRLVFLRQGKVADIGSFEDIRDRTPEFGRMVKLSEATGRTLDAPDGAEPTALKTP